MKGCSQPANRDGGDTRIVAVRPHVIGGFRLCSRPEPARRCRRRAGVRGPPSSPRSARDKAMTYAEGSIATGAGPTPPNSATAWCVALALMPPRNSGDTPGGGEAPLLPEETLSRQAGICRLPAAGTLRVRVPRSIALLAVTGSGQAQGTIVGPDLVLLRHNSWLCRACPAAWTCNGRPRSARPMTLASPAT
jgi:hypothetical protein